MQGPQVLAMVMVLVIAVCLFMLFRNILLWYWKVDKIVGNLEAIREELEQLNGKRRY